MKQAVILAAGEGRRLQPFTVNKPKAMLSVGGKPLIHYLIEALVRNGLPKIVIVVGYQKELLYNYLGDGRQLGADITFIPQSKQLGTAHALVQAEAILEEEFLVISGNALIVPETISRFIQQPPPAILVKKEDNPSLYGVVSFEGNRLTGIVEKPVRAGSDYVNTGIYLFHRKMLEHLKAHLAIPNALSSMLASDVQINVLEAESTWQNVIYPWDILTLNSTVLHNIQGRQSGLIEAGVYIKGEVSIGEGSVVHSNSYIAGPVTIGKGCEIGPNVCLLSSTSLGDNVMVSPFTEIKNCVIGNDVRIGSGSALEDSVIDNGCRLGSSFQVHSEETEIKVDSEHYNVRFGAMIGSSCRFGNVVIAQAGTIIGNNSRVNSLKIINGNIPERSWIV